MSNQGRVFLGGGLVLGLLALQALVVGCSRSESPSSAMSVAVTRGPENQPILKVTGTPVSVQRLSEAETVAHPADIALMEKQGFTVASDRMLQMLVLRALSRGETAELLGGRKF